MFCETTTKNVFIYFSFVDVKYKMILVNLFGERPRREIQSELKGAGPGTAV